LRIPIGNLCMTNHPIPLHGHEFLVTGTDGGPTPKSARWYEVTTDVAVGQMRQVELLADEEGDWAFHCHKSHHTMNAMGHQVPTLIGVDQRGVAEKIAKLVPDYMVMGDKGGSMGEMEMPIPENTLPMMGGQGPFEVETQAAVVLPGDEGAVPGLGRQRGSRFRAHPASLWVSGGRRHAGGVFGGEGGIRTLPAPLESVSYRNHVAAIAMNAVNAVGHCPPLPAGNRTVEPMLGVRPVIRNEAQHA